MKVEQRTELCGCVVTVKPGHTHTKLCDECRREAFSSRTRSLVMINHQRVERNNLDLVARDNLDLVGG